LPIIPSINQKPHHAGTLRRALSQKGNEGLSEWRENETSDEKRDRGLRLLPIAEGSKVGREKKKGGESIEKMRNRFAAAQEREEVSRRGKKGTVSNPVRKSKPGALTHLRIQKELTGGKREDTPTTTPRAGWIISAESKREPF